MKTVFQDFHTTEKNIDYLTGLCNRRGLGEVWETLPADCAVHCVYLDVDNFKLVNDIYGHAKGDQLLIFIAELLTRVFCGQMVVRMGGDEFVVLCDGGMPAASVEEKLPYLQEAICRGDFDTEVEKLLSFSIGVCLAQPVSLGMTAILEQSDMAMYHVKKNGKGGYILYDEIRERVEEENAIRERALSGRIWRELEVIYRPVVHLQTSDVIAAEAALQWHFPGRGLISGRKFVPVCKQYGMIGQIDLFLLDRVCERKTAWRGTDFQYLSLYMHLSGAYLMQKDSISQITEHMDRHGVAVGDIKFCIAEKDFIENGAKLYEIVQTMIDLGFGVAIQDFASGSSLRVLQKLPVRTLKLDRKLLTEAQENETGLCILRNVISLGRDLNCGIVAQGIEKTNQISMLANYGAQFGIGPYYGEPVLAEAFADRYGERLFFVRNRRPQMFRFHGGFDDDEGAYRGTFSGGGYTFTEGVVAGQSAVHFPGGEVKENVLLLPGEVMKSDSYSICFWVNPDLDQPWTSVIYIDYADGFMSLIPVSGHGDFFYRIKDDREANEWHDIACRQAVPGQWSYLCATYDAVTQIAKLYFNGLLVGSRENVPNMKVVRRIMVGGDEYQHSYEGKLADLEIYHYAISADDVQARFLEYQRDETFLGTEGRK